ncbi:hypothetical protein ON010_g7 [Phytophthora cinnamomi]|nr:hypothetical protein ON010_g7 [Phytophthora cinnamomi]
MTRPVGSGAPLVSNSRNTPNLSTTSFMINSAICSVACCAVATAETYFLTYSIAAMTYRSPPPARGNGPATSKAQRSPTSPPRRLRSGGITSRGRALRLPQSRHPRTHFSTSCNSSGHQYTRAIRSYVYGARTCPAHTESRLSLNAIGHSSGGKRIHFPRFVSISTKLSVVAVPSPSSGRSLNLAVSLPPSAAHSPWSSPRSSPGSASDSVTSSQFYSPAPSLRSSWRRLRHLVVLLHPPGWQFSVAFFVVVRPPLPSLNAARSFVRHHRPRVHVLQVMPSAASARYYHDSTVVALVLYYRPAPDPSWIASLSCCTALSASSLLAP